MINKEWYSISESDWPDFWQACKAKYITWEAAKLRYLEFFYLLKLLKKEIGGRMKWVGNLKHNIRTTCDI